MAIEDVDSNTTTLDWSSIINTVRHKNSLQIDRKICCADIMNCKINIYPLCTNKKCGRTVTQLPDETTVQCAYCQRVMLIEICIYGLNGEYTVEKNLKQTDLTVFSQQLVNSSTKMSFSNTITIQRS